MFILVCQCDWSSGVPAEEMSLKDKWKKNFLKNHCQHALLCTHLARQ